MAHLTNLKNLIRNYLVYWKSRTSAFLRSFRSSQHQVTSTTQLNRYPEIFTALREKAPANRDLKILSYGCSTGEECFSLRNYFKDATIIGVDISSGNLRKARKNNTDKRIEFFQSTPEVIAQLGPFDIICCFSVLCRWEDTKDMDNCERVYPFGKFDEATTFLSGHLRKDGLFAIYNSNFRFEDATIFSNFVTEDTPAVTNSGFVHKFDRNNNRVSQSHKSCIYRKEV
jgi:SAM-dependent methyltransferase